MVFLAFTIEIELDFGPEAWDTSISDIPHEQFLRVCACFPSFGVSVIGGLSHIIPYPVSINK